MEARSRSLGRRIQSRERVIIRFSDLILQLLVGLFDINFLSFSAADRGAEKIRMELEQMERAVQDQEAKLNAARAALLRGESDIELVITSVGKKR